MTQHPDEGTLHAYIDGELARAEAEALDAHVAGCASCSAALAEARGLVAATSHVITALDAAPATVRTAVPVAGRPSAVSATRAPRPLIFRVAYARAAALLLLVGGSAFVADRSGVFDGSARSRSVSTAADAVQRSEPSVVAAPEAVSRKAVPVPRMAANTATDTLRAIRQQDVAAPTSLKRVESAEGTRAPALAAAAAPPPMVPAPLARATDAQLSEALVTGVVATSARVSRYRTKDGLILTLTEETLRTRFAEESDSRRTAAASAQRPTAAPMSAPVMNSYRWSSPEQARTYTLTGPLSVAELEALSKRLSELERVP